MASSPRTRDFSASSSFASVEAEGTEAEATEVEGPEVEGREVEGREVEGREVEDPSFAAVEGSLLSFLGLRFGWFSLPSAAASLLGFLGGSLESTTPPAEPARFVGAASRAVAAFLDRACFDGPAGAVDEEGGFVDIVDRLDPAPSKLGIQEFKISQVRDEMVLLTGRYPSDLSWIVVTI